MGNVESHLVGPAPRQVLDRALNPTYGRFRQGDEWAAPPGTALVYDPIRDTFLTGALPVVKRAVRSTGMRLRLRDRRWSAPRSDEWQLRGHTLRDYQEEVVRTALQKGHGLIDIATSGGKSIIAAVIIARLGLPTLFLVTTRTLLTQTIRNLRSHLGVEPGVIGQGVREPKRLTVALIQGLDPERVDLSRWAGGTLIFDEGHHAAASTWQDLIRRIEPRYHFYLSAVPFRSGSDQAVLNALAGGRLTGGRFSAQFLIERGYACPVEVRAERIRITGDMAEKTFLGIYKGFIVYNAVRNRRIAEIACSEVEAGRSVLILVDHVRHGRELGALIGDRSAFVHGSIPKGVLQETAARFADGSLPCLIATAGLFQEGVSINGIHVLIQAGGLRSRSKVIQSVGRGMRLAHGKTRCTYVDFWDDDVSGVLRTHSRDRFRALKAEGFFFPELEATRAEARAEDVIPSMWAHVPDSRRFLLVDGDGHIRARAECVRRDCVSDRFCKRCRDRNVCINGGKITWQEEQA